MQNSVFQRKSQSPPLSVPWLIFISPPLTRPAPLASSLFLEQDRYVLASSPLYFSSLSLLFLHGSLVHFFQIFWSNAIFSVRISLIILFKNSNSFPLAHCSLSLYGIYHPLIHLFLRPSTLSLTPLCPVGSITAGSFVHC